MKRLKTFVLGFVLFALLSSTRSIALAENGDDLPAPPDQLIVKFKLGQSSEELTKEINKRKQNLKDGLLSSLKIILADVALKINGEETPESKLSKIAAAEQNAKVVYKKALFSDDQSLKNYYQIKLDPAQSMKTALSIFRALPEVEFAEADIITGNEGI